MIILLFDNPAATDLMLAGGKGANLARLSKAGFPVPDGFIIPANAYREVFGTAPWLENISAQLASLLANDPIALEAASTEIRSWFTDAPLPAVYEQDIRSAYRALGAGPVAVRSSATAEDLPDFSFAGQQDTYLNISGEADLIRAVRDCWASLWTARAIGYRARNRISSADLSLAVVVQCMVPSEFSGVLFTANPLTGTRAETVIDAIPGLGEALVSGQVEPDHYVVTTLTGNIISSQFGSRRLDSTGMVGHEDGRARLSEMQIRDLASLGLKVALAQGGPQDIEWAFALGKLHLLQSRAITSLYPIPDSLLAGPPRVMFSFGAVQGLLDPITPIGQDSFQRLISGLGGIFGFHIVPDSQTVLLAAGERLWINITALMQNTFGRKILFGALAFVDPAAKLSLQQLADDPLFTPNASRPPIRLALQLMRHAPPVLLRVLRYLVRPQHTLADAIATGDQFLAKVERECAQTGDPAADLARRAGLVTAMTERLPDAILGFITGLMAGMASFNLFRVLSMRWLPEMRGQIPTLSLEATRGLPSNVTTEMDLSLFGASRRILAYSPGSDHILAFDAQTLSKEYLSGMLPPPTQRAISAFMRRYGARGLAEIDLGRPRWREDPSPVMQTLKSYLSIEDGPLSPDRVFAHGAEEAEKVLERIFTAVRAKPGGRIKEIPLRFFAGRMRALMGIRESPKFLIIRMIGFLREALLESGFFLQEAGTIENAEDVFFLHLQELESFAAGNTAAWKPLIADRRSHFDRETRRRRVPRLLVSDGRALYESIPASGVNSAHTLKGDPVSPGVAVGRVRVIRDPRGARLETGEILVCPGTDPSWTPLFLAAGGLVMEVGGMMTHGSVVAREYGIPAVVGVDFATERLETGMLVRVDGTRGVAEILDGKDPS